MRRIAFLALAAAALAGCGGDDEPAPPPVASPSSPTATATATPTPTPTPTATPAPTEEPQPTATETPAPEDRPGGAGDEEEIRVPVELTVDSDGSLSPRRVSVPAFLGLELIVRNESSLDLSVTLEGADPLTVPAGDTARTELPGRRPGRYPIDAGPAGRAVLVTGVEPGP